MLFFLLLTKKQQQQQHKQQLLKAQLADCRLKCELLEQSLRVIAQENLHLEEKTFAADSFSKQSTSAGATSSSATIRNAELAANSSVSRLESSIVAPPNANSTAAAAATNSIAIRFPPVATNETRKEMCSTFASESDAYFDAGKFANENKTRTTWLPYAHTYIYAR